MIITDEEVNTINAIKLYQKLRLTESEVSELKAQPTFPFARADDMLIYIYPKKGSSDFHAEAISRYFAVETVVYNFETKLYSDVLSINTLRGTETTIIERSVLSPRCFEEMNARGLVYNNRSVNLLLEYVNLSEGLAPVRTDYSSVGWILDSESLSFYGLKDNNEFHYSGDKELSPVGKLSDYTKRINRLITGRTGLEITLLAALSSALVGLLSLYQPMETLLLHFYGNSSNGKTTALQLCCSVWGNPAMGKGLLSSWNATDNAILSKLNYNFGIVQCFDEASALPRNFSSLLYAISQNTSKSRLSKSSQLVAEKKFCTTIVSSGESSLLASSNQNSGLRVRVLEFFNAPLTDSAEHSNLIKSFVSQNHGTLGAEFTNILINTDISSIFCTYNQLVGLMLSKIKKRTSITERLVAKYAIILTTATIANQHLGIQVDEDNIIDFLLQHHKGLAYQSNIGERAYDCILDWVTRNRGKLLTETNRQSNSIVEGTFLKGNCVALLCSTFDRILAENSFTDTTVILHELKSMGILKPESADKLKARVVVNGIKKDCYRLYIKDLADYEPIEYVSGVTEQELLF